MRSGNQKSLSVPFKIALYVILITFAVLVLIPLSYIVSVSVSDISKVYTDAFSFLKDFKLIENYSNAWAQGRIGTYMKNTIFVMALSAGVIIFTSSICAYGMRRYRFKEIQFMYYLLLTGFFIPTQVIIIQLFRILKLFHLIDTLWGLIVVYSGKGLALAMMLFVGFFKSIPRELDESSMIDGCGPFKTYWRILLPLSIPAVVAVTILCGLTVWRDFFIPLVIIITPHKNGTLALGLLRFLGEYMIEWTKMCAAMVMHTVPIVILYLLLQKYFVSGITAGSIKG